MCAHMLTPRILSNGVHLLEEWVLLNPDLRGGLIAMEMIRVS